MVFSSRLARFACLLAFASCAGQSPTSPPAPGDGDDLPIGDFEDGKADGGDPTWGYALTCKDVPDLPALVAPHITLSINGLTLHLVDEATGFDKVFPVGPGKIDLDMADQEFGESLSYEPVLATGQHDFAITPATIQTCKTWWTDPESGAMSPVFAGLPFLSWHGNYAIHGPIDNYKAANGGSLRRGFVSHGCFRMEAADILEVYARIKGVAKVPVHVQREPERRKDGSRVDLADKWIGAECKADAECNYAGGFCATNGYSDHGFCSAHCTTYCSDKHGAPSTFCVDDPHSTAGTGMCVPKVTDVDYQCRSYEGLSEHPGTPRHNQPSVTADVCEPGSQGWVGDRCQSDADCSDGTTCGDNGTCTESCTKYCPDEPGYASTFCAAGASGGTCERQCTPSSNASECPAGEACVLEARASDPSVQRYVCR